MEGYDTMKIVTPYCLIESCKPNPLLIKLGFDLNGTYAFCDSNTIDVEMATRHCRKDRTEYYTGSNAEWSVEKKDNTIVFSQKVYQIYTEYITLSPSMEASCINFDYTLTMSGDANRTDFFYAHEIGTLLFRSAMKISDPVVYIAGRQGVCGLQETISREILVDYDVPIAGWMHKCNPLKSFWITSGDRVHALADWVQGREWTWIGLNYSVVPNWQFANYPAAHAAWPEEMSYTGDTVLRYRGQIMNGYLSDADKQGLLLSGTNGFMRSEQEFVFATTILGTFRPYTEERKWFNRTAIAIHHELAPYYDWSWMRDNAYGYSGAAFCAGSAVHKAFADEIDSWMKAPRNEHNLWPHNTGITFYQKGELWKNAWANNLDTPAQIIEMLYTYLTQTGDIFFLKDHVKEIGNITTAMTEIIERNPHGRMLPWIHEHGDTYMDLGFIRGEQTYLTTVLYKGFLKLAVLYNLLGRDGQEYTSLAKKIKEQANLDFSEGGLWDSDAGCFIGWRTPEGSKEPTGGHESYGNMIAAANGLCDSEEKIKSIIAWADRNSDELYFRNASPMSHANVAYNVGGVLKFGGLLHGVPWILGWDIKSRYETADENGIRSWKLLLKSFYETDYAFVEGSGNFELEVRSNRGRIWDSWGLLYSLWYLYGGIHPDIGHVSIRPVKLDTNESTQICFFLAKLPLFYTN
jgi:hypothetical protein